MAHHKSAKKRIITNQKRREINKGSVSKIKTLIKKVYSTEDKTKAETVLKEAVAYLDKTSAKGIIHRNNAARKKSTLTKYVNGLK